MISISSLLKYAMLAIPVLVCLAGIVLLFLNRKGNVLTLIRSNLHHWWKRLPLILGGAVAYMLLWLLVCKIENMIGASVVVSFNFPEASQGLNPNQTRFSMQELLADEVLEEAVAQSGLTDVDASEIKKYFTITPLKVEKTVSYEHPYITTEYQIFYEDIKNFGRRNPRQLVELVADIFKEKYTENYARKTAVLDLDFTGIDDQDYLDINEILEVKANNLQDYALACQIENYGFISEETGESFGSLQQKIENLKSVSLEKYEAFVLQNGLSKDKKNYISKLNYDNKIISLSYMKNLSSYQVRLEAIDMYKRDITRIALVPTRDEDGEFYMSRTKLGVDYFADEAEVAMTTASEQSRRIEFNNYAISSMEAHNGNETLFSQADSMIESIKNQLLQLSGLLRDTVKEYDRKRSNTYVVISKPSTDFKEVYQVKNGIILSAALAVLLAGTSLVMPAAETERKRKRK